MKHMPAPGDRKVTTEQSVLRISIIVTFVLAAAGVVFGLLSGSYSIVFDGVYALTDAIMTIVALIVSNLIVTSATTSAATGRFVKHFTMGFWHLEPMVLGLNGILLTGAAVYALINAVGSILAGGRHLSFDHAIIYAVLTMIVAFAMAAYARRMNKTLKSNFIALDAKAWVMTGYLSGALLIAFVFGLFIQGTSLQWMSPYVDPAALALVCIIVIPMPIGTIKQSFADILLMTPTDLREHVDRVAADVVRRYSFMSYRSYVARVGRGKQIELYFIVPSGGPAKRLEEWDAIRDEIGEAIGDESPDRWLTIAFTTDPEWAD